MILPRKRLSSKLEDLELQERSTHSKDLGLLPLPYSPYEVDFRCSILMLYYNWIYENLLHSDKKPVVTTCDFCNDSHWWEVFQLLYSLKFTYALAFNYSGFIKLDGTSMDHMWNDSNKFSILIAKPFFLQALTHETFKHSFACHHLPLFSTNKPPPPRCMILGMSTLHLL